MTTDRNSRAALDIPRDAPPLRRELGELVEDFAGIGLRDLKMIRDIYWRPARVIRTMAAGEREEYGSAFRLWIGLVSLSLFTSLLAGGMGQTIVNADARQGGDIQAKIIASGRDYAAVINDFESWLSILIIPIGALAMIPLVLLLRGFAGRIRLSRQLQVLAAITVSMTLISVFSSPFIIPHAGEPQYALISLLPMLVYMLTFARGGAGLYHHSVGGMLIKSALFGILTLVLNFLGSFLAMTAALVLAIIQNAPA